MNSGQVDNEGLFQQIDQEQRVLEEQKRLLMLDPDEAARSHFFPVRPRLLRIQASMKGQARALIRSNRADELVEAFPTPGNSTHALVSGEFVMGNVIDRVRSLRGDPLALWIATLSLGLPNVETLKAAAQAGIDTRVLVSHFFESKDDELFAAISRELQPVGVQLYVARLHAKVILFDYPDTPYVITTSANLRSSNNLETVDVFAWPDLFLFHRAWMAEVIARSEAGTNPTFAIKL